MNHYSYRNLKVWQKAQLLIIMTIDSIEQVPYTTTNKIITQQIIRSVTSISANIAEGHARYTPKVYRNHLLIARGSLAETNNWLDILYQRKTIDEQAYLELQAMGQEIFAMLTSMSKKLE